jgi:hypothetical protein
MNFRRILDTPIGIMLISIMLGFGIACLFRRVCTDGQCIHFCGAIIDDIHDKIYEHNGKCYTYKAKSTTCTSTKKIIDVSEPLTD